MPALIEALRDSDVKVRQGAAQALVRADQGAQPAMPALIEALRDPEGEVRAPAAFALGPMGPEAMPALVEALRDPDHMLRWAAASALGQMGPGAQIVVLALVEALRDPDRMVRFAAASALEQMGPGAVPALIEALRDPGVEVRQGAALALGQIGPGVEAATTIPELIKVFNDRSHIARQNAATALASNARALQDTRATDMIGPLQAALAALTGHSEPFPRVQEHAATVKRAVDYLELLWWHHLYAQFRQGVHDHLYLVAGLVAYFILFLTCMLCYWLRPLWLYGVSEALKLPRDVTLPAWLGGLKLPLLYVFLVGFFQYRRRVLDAWVTQHLPTARAEFERKVTVSDRAVHIPVPVILEGHTVPQLTVGHLRPTFEKPRACLLIWGEGGAGKTSLACQVARWAMADTPTERLCAPHCMLPVLLEQGVEPKGEGLRPLLEAIRGELRALIAAEDPIPEELLRQLLRRRRVVVLIDHFSEMPEATRQAIRPGHSEFPINALVVTSRLDERLDGVPRTTVKPLRIQRDRLSSFMEAYLTQRNARDYFNDVEFLTACVRLASMVGTRDITVLLAKLYAEQMIAAKTGLTAGDLPETIPDLMLSYVNEINRGVDPPKLEDRQVHQVTKVLAWECLKRTYRPTPASRQAVLAALAGKPDAEARLTYLETRLRLIQTIGAERNEIRLTLDPLAEYLAGLYVVETCGSNVGTWKEFLTRAEALPGGVETIREFLLAVRDCCLAKGENARVPGIIVGELNIRVGIGTEVVEMSPI